MTGWGVIAGTRGCARDRGGETRTSKETGKGKGNRKGKERLEEKRGKTRRYPDAEKSSPLSTDNGVDFHVVRRARAIARLKVWRSRAQGRPDNRLFHFPLLSCHVPLHHGNLHARHVPETIKTINALISLHSAFAPPATTTRKVAKCVT
jgi:hypothetical protein